MNEPTITCPSCKTDIKLTESLAAPLVEATRKRFEGLLEHKEKEVAAREAVVRSQQDAVEQTKAGLEQQLAERLTAERQRISAEEAKKANLIAAADISKKVKELADLQEVLKDRDIKLAKAQQAEAELFKKQRELDDVRREVDLTIEKKVQESLARVREKAKQEAENALRNSVQEKEAQVEAMREQLAKGEEARRAQQVELEQSRSAMETELAERIQAERKRIAAEESNKANLLAATEIGQKAKELADLQEVLKERDVKLAEAQAAQVELIKKQRELDDARRELNLTVEKRIQESLASVREKAKQEAEDTLKFKVVEKEEQIASMQRQIEELRRKAEQGSQQLQGEASELELETMLRAKFPQDVIEPVGKGEFGGDVQQYVMNPNGQRCGSILWESKRTKNWNDGWLAKLRRDQREAKADIAVIVSNALPKGVSTFDLVEEVWVSEHRCALPVAMCLRQSLIETAAARQAGEGQQTKMELVYQYLTGPRFKQRVQAIVEKFTDMNDDLERERKIMTKNWAKREAQIRGVIDTTSGLYGDLQGIAGKALVDIEVLSVPLLEGDDASASE